MSYNGLPPDLPGPGKTLAEEGSLLRKFDGVLPEAYVYTGWSTQ